MKFSHAGAVAALTLASLLSACGGKAQYTVQGTVTGLTMDGLVLKNNGGDDITLNAGTSTFAFPKQIDYGASYDITLEWSQAAKNNNAPAILACGVSGATGYAGYTLAISAAVTCQPVPYSVGGYYEGFTEPATPAVPAVPASGSTPATDAVAAVPDTVTLINGSSGNAVTISSSDAGAGNFALSQAFASGDVYAVTISKQPAKSTCVLTNNTGRVATVNVSSLRLTCTKN